MTILIIEDQAGIADFLQEGLQEEGFKTIWEQDGKIGLEAFFSSKPDLVLLDWMLPSMEGLQICKLIREKDPETPIIFLTAKDTVPETIEGLKAGANDYLKKPFSFEELLLRIKVHLKSFDNDSLRLGNLVLNDKTHQVFYQDVEIVLTQKEFLLLKYLVQNKNQICNRNQIIKDVWDIHFEYDTGIIDVYMNAIRKKLNLKPEDNYLKTIRGIGYMAQD